MTYFEDGRFDLTGLADRQAVSVPTWLTARRAAERMDPPVPVAVALPAATLLAVRLDRVSLARILPRYGTAPAAKAALTSRLPLTGRIALRLDPDVPAPALARNLVTDACGAWGLSTLLHPARLVVSELATNAVVHARTPFTVVATLRRTGLHVAVSDHDRRLPRLLAPDGIDDIGRGLRLVAAATTAWGALPTADGKMVWAVLHPRHRLR